MLKVLALLVVLAISANGKSLLCFSFPKFLFFTDLFTFLSATELLLFTILTKIGSTDRIKRSKHGSQERQHPDLAS